MLPPPQDTLRQQQLPPPPPLRSKCSTGTTSAKQAYQQVNRVEENRDQPPPPAPLGRNVYEDPHLCMVVFVTEPTDRQSVHRRSMEVNAVMPAVPKYMLWSDQEITWSFKDHPKIMPNPGGYALVVDPIMKGPETRVKFSKVLIDNGSSINIMYKHTMRVPRELAEHSLNVRKDAKPVRQPLRRFAEDRRKIIGEEVTKLLVAGFIARTEWLANPVMVEKKKDENLEAQAPKADAAFKELKNMLVTAPILASPLEREPMFQKMTYGVFMAATKLKHYFEEHPMKVVSEAPISDIMGNKDASGRIAKWAIQLSPYVPVYERRDAIKSQALADFLVDWAEIQYKPPEHNRIPEDAL
ncbi:hypothetical protein QYE76_068006 [Lolium multiflorum]|uniref:Uncharacterized protein n=1 Tax=Lolium multiflorum TaxID=4521 RepID=A0AAD8SEZ4_LOLMU|nr:hypothetical protein QYE76_068006 [Lolium multiflorum]